MKNVDRVSPEDQIVECEEAVLYEGPDLGRLQDAPLRETTRDHTHKDDSLQEEELHYYEARVLKDVLSIVRK